VDQDRARVAGGQRHEVGYEASLVDRKDPMTEMVAKKMVELATGAYVTLSA
jgi:hypothetical protein